LTSIKKYEEHVKANQSPIDRIAHGEDIALGVEVLSHAHLPKAIDGHYTDIQRKYRPAILVTRNHGNRVAL